MGSLRMARASEKRAVGSVGPGVGVGLGVGDGVGEGDGVGV
jgi:hypothetical protein